MPLLFSFGWLLSSSRGTWLLRCSHSLLLHSFGLENSCRLTYEIDIDLGPRLAVIKRYDGVLRVGPASTTCTILLLDLKIRRFFRVIGRRSTPSRSSSCLSILLGLRNLLFTDSSSVITVTSITIILTITWMASESAAARLFLAVSVSRVSEVRIGALLELIESGVFALCCLIFDILVCCEPDP